MDPHFYEVNVTWQQDRKGIMQSPELIDEVAVATPPQFPKGIEGIWSPEHLFTAAVSGCFMTTFLAIAENSKLEFIAFDVKSKGKLEQIEGKFKMSEIILQPTVAIVNEGDRERAERILQKSEAACLITNSISSKVTMEPQIIISKAQ